MAFWDRLPGMGILRGLGRVGVHRVRGRSMEPRFFDGELLLVWGSDERGLRRGDVVVFRHPSIEGRLMLKRVAALPGERVGVVGGRVLVEGGATMETGDGVGKGDEGLWEMEWVMGENQWFVLGDNPESSLDSRRLGPIRGSWIRGRVWFRYWPLLRRRGGG